MGALPGLRSTEDFRRVRRSGRSWAHPLLVLFVAPGTEPATRVGISVSKRVGGAVVRNRVKRRIREIMREQLSSLRPGWDLMIVARQGSATATYAELSEAMTRLLGKAALAETNNCSASSR